MAPAKKNSRPPTPKRDPQKTRATILKCATRAFARSGFEGASLSEILERAKLNKRMVYHYYGSKEGLYRAVHIHQWQNLAEWFAQELIPSPEPSVPLGLGEEALMKAIEIFHDFASTHQEFLRLLMWDALEGGKVSRSIWTDIRGPLYWRMEALVQAAQKEGVIPKDLQASHFVMSFMGAILFYFSGADSLVDVFQKEPLSEAALKERKVQIVTLFRHILAKKS